MIVRRAQARDAQAIASVHIESWRTTYAGIVPTTYLSSLSLADRAQYWDAHLRALPERHCVYVTETDKQEIVGFAAGGHERSGDPLYTGELYALYLLARYQRQGLGRQLFAAVASELAANGYPSLLIWVLADNPSRLFYQSLQGILLHSQQVVIGGAALEEVAYGWADIGTLLRACGM